MLDQVGGRQLGSCVELGDPPLAPAQRGDRHEARRQRRDHGALAEAPRAAARVAEDGGVWARAGAGSSAGVGCRVALTPPLDGR